MKKKAFTPKRQHPLGQPLKRLAVANRGEVAVRILQSAQELGMETVLLHSEVDRQSRAYRLAHHRVCIGGAEASESYLNMEAVLAGAKKARAHALHPGFGFLSENPLFVRKCQEAGICFVGPSPESMELLSNKVKAKELAEKLSIPTLPSYSTYSARSTRACFHATAASHSSTSSPKGGSFQRAKAEKDSLFFLEERAKSMGFPVIVKAAAGGGGRGMKILWKENSVKENLLQAQQEAISAFGSDHLFLEKYLPQAKHIEVQVFAESDGEVLHLFERECSIQRKQQKIIEESPSPAVDSALRKAMVKDAIALIKATNYQGAATVEFLLDGKNYYFMEVNTRLQVEHPVTEMLLGVDLVKAQLINASGKRAFLKEKIGKKETRGELKAKESAIREGEGIFLPRGHVIECRIYAENPFQNQLPSLGLIHHLHWPLGQGRRFDSGFEAGDSISPYYDSMIAKVIVQDKTRPLAIQKMQHTLGACRIFGIQCNIPLLQAILSHEEFIHGHMHTRFMEEHFPQALNPKDLEELKKKFLPLKEKVEEHLSQLSSSLNPKGLEVSEWAEPFQNPNSKTNNPFYDPSFKKL